MPHEKHSRRDFLTITGLAAVSLAIPIRGWARLLGVNGDLNLYVGTYTSGKSEGIYIYRMNMSTGELKHFNTVKGVVDPSFLAIDRHRCRLYAVDEVEQFAGKPSGALSAFSIDQQSGNLSFLNQQPGCGDRHGATPRLERKQRTAGRTTRSLY